MTDRPHVHRKPLHLPIVGAVAPERSDAARNRAAILQATRRLLARKSIDCICMDEVARAAGVGKGTVYRRFADRSALCRALLDDNERLLQDAVLRGFDLPSAAPAELQLWALLDALLCFVLQNASLLAEAQAFEAGKVDRYDLSVHVWRRLTLVRSLREVQAAKVLLPLDAPFVAQAILALLTPDLVLWSLREQANDPVKVRAQYLAGIGRLLGLAVPEVAPWNHAVEG